MKTRKWVRRSLCMVVAMTAQRAMAAESSAKIEELIVKGLKVERSLVDIYQVLQQSANVNGTIGSSCSIRGVGAFAVTTEGRGGSHNGLASADWGVYFAVKNLFDKKYVVAPRTPTVSVG